MMADTLTLYTNPMSRGRIARWMLEEVGQPYDVVLLDYGTTMKAPDYLAINPMGKVPAITHGDVVVTEAAAVCAYLADAFPEAGLAPASTSPLRGAYLRWLFFAAGPLEAAVADKAMGLIVPADKQAFAGYGSYAKTLDVLEAAVSAGEWLAGDNFSAADLYVGAHLSWGLMFGTIEKRRAFEVFVDRATSRPAHQRASELDDAGIPPKAE